jgi:type IV secretory pathway TraG/TraD family ATPase VirD4
MSGDLSSRIPFDQGSPERPAAGIATAVSVPCYEGPDRNGHPGSIELSHEALIRHLLILGSTGAGKTTLLRRIMRELIGQNASDLAAKPALVVFDFKGDTTVDFVTDWAKRHGRERDVRVLSLNSRFSYDFFGGFDDLSKVQEYVERLLFACGTTNSNDCFWDEYREGLLAAALTWSKLTEQTHNFSPWVSQAASWLLNDRLPAELRLSHDQLEEVVKAMPADKVDRPLGEFALNTIHDWDRGLESRTKSNVRATLSNALRPLLAPNVQRLFRTQAEDRVSVREALEQGQIVIVSVNAFLEPHLASLLGKCIKADFYQGVFRRGNEPKASRRLAMLIADEYHLAATVGGERYDDAVALPLLREFNAGVIAATQTIAGLDRTIGKANRSVLLPNFCTAFFFRNTETETAEWASRLCGTRMEDEIILKRRLDPKLPGYRPPGDRITVRKVHRLVCSPAALARLEPGQAFMYRQFDPPPTGPIWIAAEP